MHYLLKTEPSDYSIAQLQSDNQCTWDGVENALALKHLRAICKGEKCFIYHTGKEKQIVGLAEAITDAYEKNGAWVIDLKFVQTYSKPLTLAQMKASQAFGTFELLRLPRLSVMPVPEDIVREVLKAVS